MKSAIILLALVATVYCAPAKPFGHGHRLPTNFIKDDTRIMFGEETTIDKFPHMGIMFMLGSFRCGVSIISDRYFLTAAHCVVGYESVPGWFNIAVGRTNRYNSDGEEIAIESISSHEQYNSNSFENDIAVMRTSRTIPFSGDIQPVDIDRSSSQNEHVGVKGTVSGWGTTEFGSNNAILRFGDLHVLSNEYCNSWSQMNGRVTPDMVCGQDEDEGGRTDVCSGDSGSAFVRYYGDAPVQIGVVSWGFIPCISSTHIPSVFARVSYFADWIDSNMR